MSTEQKIKYVTAKDAADLERIQNGAIKAVQSARIKVQIALVATLIHAAKHGDYTGANRLVAGVGNAVNGAALVEFFVRFGGLLVNSEGNAFDGWKGNDFIKENLNEAKATMWWELKKVNPFKGYDAEAALKQFIANHERMVGKMEEMSDEDKAKVNVTISDATIKLVLKIAKFEALFEEAQTEAVEA